MKKDTKKVNIIVLKGDRNVEGVAIKQNAIEVVLNFVAKHLDLPLYNGKFVYEIRGLDPVKVGDAQWLRENVFRKVDIYGTTDENSSKQRAERLISVYNELAPKTEMVGMAIIRYFLEQMYMQYDITE